MRIPALIVVAFLAVAPQLAGQAGILPQEGYLTPPPEIVEAVTAPRHENITLSNLSPNGEVFLNSEGMGMRDIEDYARPFYRLGGIAIDPAANRSRGLTTGGSLSYEVIRWTDGERITLEAPVGARVSGSSWSPDGERLAFLAHNDEATHLWVSDVASGDSRQVTATPLMATRTSSYSWSGDGQYLFAVLLPEARGPAPTRGAAPSTPLIRMTYPGEQQHRTYASLLKDPYEADLLEYHSTGQLARIEVATGAVHPIGDPAMILGFSTSPQGDYLRVTTQLRPFSYIVPASRFGNVEEVWDLDGNVLLELDRTPLRDGRDRASDDDDNDEPDRRSLTWRPDGQGFSFLQREPELDDDEDRSRMDRVMQWHPPFDDESVEVVYETEDQIRSLSYSADARTLFLTHRSDGHDRVYAVFLDEPDVRYQISEEEVGEFYDNPGSLMNTRNELGSSVVRMSTDGAHVFLSGTEYFENPLEEAPRPFVDRVEIRTGETERLFESAPDMFERVSAVLDDDLSQVIVTRESPTTVADSWLMDTAGGELTRLTENVDHTPDITRARREILDVTRPDGITFRVQVTLPADYQEGDRLPAMFWHYPREYTSQEAYDRSNRNYNKNRFPSVGTRSMEILTRRGYAVVNHDHPTIGESGRINDNFIPDLRANLLTVIDALDERGWIDRRRLALGGHSYGGFGTIHALVQTPYFRAGIAGAPNSNRLLTPMGFQSERRSLWEARETYLEMSPFMWAERMNGALLIYHGEDDQNTGTFPVNSWRLIHALQGLDKTAALYMYPHEGHGQSAEATILDMWARWVAWLDHYVRDADVSEPVAPFVAEDEDRDGSDREAATRGTGGG